MTTTNRSLRTLLGAAALAALAASVVPAFAQTKVQTVQQPVGVATDLAAAPKHARVTPVPCNSVASCNSIISYCAEKGGNWKETSSNGQGQPDGGTCYLP
jgi:hypothetical protein